METRVALISIIVSQADRVETLNELLHEYSEYIIGRMGIPYKVNNSLTGALGRLDGINAKVTYAKV